jgi:predicted N-acetyltransferase YhbS
MNGTTRFRVSFRAVSASQRPRALQMHEWPALRAAINLVFRPNGGDLTRDTPLLFEEANLDNLRIISDDSQPSRQLDDGSSNGPRVGAGNGGRIVAHAGFAARDAVVRRRRVRVACVGGVFTVPDQRGKGLASRVLADALDRARRGRDLVLCSGDRGLYRRHGLEPIAPLVCFRLPASDTDSSATTMTNAAGGTGAIRAATVDDLGALAALYDAEEVHFVRSTEDWTRLWHAGTLVDAPAAFSVVCAGGRPVAYLVAQHASRRGDSPVRPRRILELAGDRAAVVAAASVVGDELLIPRHDALTISLCEAKGWPRTDRRFSVTAQALTMNTAPIPWYGLNYL